MSRVCVLVCLCACLSGALAGGASPGFLPKRVAIYGGSFDPITAAHLQVAAEVINSKSADEVWMVPCGMRMDKDTQVSPEQRLIMLNLAVETTFTADFPIKINEEEVRNGKALTTFELLTRLQGKHPEYEFWFVLGADLVPSLPKWTHGTELLKIARFIINPRPGYELPRTQYPAGSIGLDDHGFKPTVTQLSSTEIRKRFILDPSSIEGLLPVAVQNYIKRNGLYKTVIKREAATVSLDPAAVSESPITTVTEKRAEVVTVPDLLDHPSTSVRAHKVVRVVPEPKLEPELEPEAEEEEEDEEEAPQE